MQVFDQQEFNIPGPSREAMVIVYMTSGSALLEVRDHAAPTNRYVAVPDGNVSVSTVFHIRTNGNAMFRATLAPDAEMWVIGF